MEGQIHPQMLRVGSLGMNFLLYLAAKSSANTVDLDPLLR